MTMILQVIVLPISACDLSLTLPSCCPTRLVRPSRSSLLFHDIRQFLPGWLLPLQNCLTEFPLEKFSRQFCVCEAPLLSASISIGATVGVSTFTSVCRCVVVHCGWLPTPPIFCASSSCDLDPARVIFLVISRCNSSANASCPARFATWISHSGSKFTNVLLCDAFPLNSCSSNGHGGSGIGHTSQC